MNGLNNINVHNSFNLILNIDLIPLTSLTQDFCEEKPEEKPERVGSEDLQDEDWKVTWLVKICWSSAHNKSFLSVVHLCGNIGVIIHEPMESDDLLGKVF